MVWALILRTKECSQGNRKDAQIPLSMKKEKMRVCTLGTLAICYRLRLASMSPRKICLFVEQVIGQTRQGSGTRAHHINKCMLGKHVFYTFQISLGSKVSNKMYERHRACGRKQICDVLKLFRYILLCKFPIAEKP